MNISSSKKSLSVSISTPQKCCHNSLCLFSKLGTLLNTIEFDFWFLKLSQEGEILLNKTYGGNGDDRGQSIVEISGGGYLLVGYSKSSDGDASKNQGFHDNWIIRIDSDGTILWEQSIGFSGHDHANSIIETKDGGFFITGFLDVSASNGNGNYGKGINNNHGVGEFWGHKLNSEGKIIWSRYFGGTNLSLIHI